MHNESIYTECMTKVYDSFNIHERHIINSVNLLELLKLLDVVETHESDGLGIQYCFRCEDAHDTSYTDILYSVGGDAYFCDTDCLAGHIVEHIHLIHNKKGEMKQ